jgi:hypothetical protein
MKVGPDEGYHRCGSTPTKYSRICSLKMMNFSYGVNGELIVPVKVELEESVPYEGVLGVGVPWMKRC